MTLSLYSSPYEIMTKYLRMTSHGEKDRISVKIIAELNAISTAQVRQILSIEQKKINEIGLEEYRQKYMHTKPDRGERYTYIL